MAGPDSIKLLRRQWETNARLDPYWSILTRKDRRKGRWDREEFFATGRADVAAHLERLRAAGLEPRRGGRALDFGCGLGRLTRPLAEAMGSAVGVDVSARMVEQARQLHAGVPGLEFRHNPQPDLSAFESGSFDLAYSLLTLQHMPPELARSYLAELVRVCRPDGAVFIQIVTRSAPWSGNLFWPPTLVKLLWRRLNRRIAVAPVMVMYALPVAEAEGAIRAAGGEVIAVWPDKSAGERFESVQIAARGGP